MEHEKKNTKPFRRHSPIIESDSIRYFNDSYNTLVSKILLPSKVKFDAEILITGMTNVGKKTLLRWIEDGRFIIYDQIYMGGCNVSVETKVNKSKRLNLSFSTTGGQERFGIYISNHIYNIYLIVYDVGKRESFNIVNHILNKINDLKKIKNFQPLILLIGNKIDEKDKREVSTNEGKKYAKDNNLLYFEISVKSEQKCYEFFNYLNWTVLLQKYEKELNTISDNIKNDNDNITNNNNNSQKNENENTTNNNNNSILNKIINLFFSKK